MRACEAAGAKLLETRKLFATNPPTIALMKKAQTALGTGINHIHHQCAFGNALALVDGEVCKAFGG
jgi:hypothetical protein